MSEINANPMVRSVVDFHKAFDHYVSTEPTLTPCGCDDPESLHNLRLKLIEEELSELKEALANRDIVEVADAITDLMYVVIGAGIVYGLPLERLFDEVHRSNMTKLGSDGKPLLNGINCTFDPTRPMGKVRKGPDFREPNIRDILNV